MSGSAFRTRNIRVVVVLALVAALAVGIPFVRSHGSIDIDGLNNNAVLGRTALADFAIRVVPHGVSGSSLHASVDGQAVSLTDDGRDWVAHPAGLPDGTHTFTVKGSHGFFGHASASRRFVVDTTPPRLRLTPASSAVSIAAPVDVEGTVTGASKVIAEGGRVTLSGSHLTVHYSHPPIGARVIAVDAAGNRAVREITVPTSYPDNVRGVHMTGYAWASTTLRKPILKLAREHRINTIELDIKEEDGLVDFDPGVALAHRAHAVVKKYDPVAVVRQLHRMGVRVMGRIVAFNDPKLGQWAWTHGHRNWLVQKPNHQRYVYGYAHSNFTNFAQPAVRAYNIAIAKAAVRDGFDDIVFDYIRRPDGPLRSMRFPGIPNSKAEDGIVEFTREAAQSLHAMGAYVGATIFAQAALPNRAAETAQNVPRMARYLDAVMPMDYPSHWGPNELGVHDPHRDVYGIVHRSLKYWQRAVRGTHCAVVAWLQDEDYLGHYTAAVVRREIQGARDDGLPGWVMWSAVARYTRLAFTPNATRVLD